MVKVKLFADGKTYEYTEGVGENLEKSGRGKILGKVGVRITGADLKKDEKKGKNKDK